jgi:hypothetical protein
MFGLPIEVTVGMVSALGGFAMKLMAQKQADTTALIKLGMEKAAHSSTMADAAAKRSSPWLRKFAAITVLLVAFGGILLVAFFDSVPVSIVYEKVPRSFLGLFKWGGNLEVVEANGFVLADWFKFSVISIVMFLFGTGAAKAQR